MLCIFNAYAPLHSITNSTRKLTPVNMENMDRKHDTARRKPYNVIVN